MVNLVFPGELSSDGSANSNYMTGNKPPSQVPVIPVPDYIFTDDAQGSAPSNIGGANYTYGAVDGSAKVIEANYTPEGIQGDSSAWAEITYDLPVEAVQIIMTYMEYIPASYASTDASNHKSISFRGGPYGITTSNISVNSECWPVAGGGTPSMYSGYDGINNGHLMTSGDPLLWENAEAGWHEVTAVLELAQGEGQYGRYRVYRDGVKLIDSASGNGMANRYDGKPSYECIGYSTRGNYIDHVRLCGWCNPASSGTPAYSGTMHFLYDDLEIRANTTFKTIVEPS